MALIIAKTNCWATSGSTAAGTAAGAEEDVNEDGVGGGGGGCGAGAAAAALVVHIATTGLEVLASDTLMKSTSKPLPHQVALSLQSLKLWLSSGI